MFHFENSYARLPDQFHSRLHPTPVRAPRLIRLNVPLARDLGLDPESLSGSAGAAIFSGNELPEGAEPLAMAYAGHQFGGWVPQLGDGRAILIGEVLTPAGLRRDIQLKGSGPTPFSRSGDGRAALGPVLREYILSEAMAALGIPTTRALAVVTTGEPVFRETPLTGAVLTRVAASHVRVGTFQYFASRGDTDALRALADHVIARHDPEAKDAPNPYRAMLDGVIRRQAELVARWMGVGFIHGVMNTDNTSISGETIDYGPCAFMDAYDPNQVYSSIDVMGRYAYANQPRIAHWNLTRLAESILPLLSEDEKQAVDQAQSAIDAFPDRYNDAYLRVMRAKLGLVEEQTGDEALIRDVLNLMMDSRSDFTLTFRRLSNLPTEATESAGETSFRELFASGKDIDDWLARWRARLTTQQTPESERRSSQRAMNPAFIPRNHRVQEALEAAERDGDFSLFETLTDALEQPFDNQPGREHLMNPPRPDQIVRRTFCGT